MKHVGAQRKATRRSKPPRVTAFAEPAGPHTNGCGRLRDVWRSCHPISASKLCSKLTISAYFWMFRCRFVWQAQGVSHLVTSEQALRVFCSSFKVVVVAKMIFMSCGRRGTRDMFIRYGQGAGFLQRAAFSCIRSSGLLDDFA